MARKNKMSPEEEVARLTERIEELNADKEALSRTEQSRTENRVLISELEHDIEQLIEELAELEGAES